MEVEGYDYDEERNILSILTHKFFQEDEMQTLTKSIIDTKFKRLEGFYEKCLDELYINLEETSEAYSMAYNIYRYSIENKIDKIRFSIYVFNKILLMDSPKTIFIPNSFLLRKIDNIVEL